MHCFILIVGYIFLQVSPELYGDNYPRFFTYWTVSIIIYASFSLFPPLFLCIDFKKHVLYLTDRCISNNWMLQLIVFRLYPN